MATFVNNGRQNGKGKEGSKKLTLEEKRKRNTHSMMMMWKGFLMS